MAMFAYNRTRGEELVVRGRQATDLYHRLRGLIGVSPLQPGEGLLIRPCSGIHTFGLRFTIDAIFIDGKGHVVKVAASVRPNRPGQIALGAAAVLELPEGTIARTGTQVGDVIEVG